MIDARRSRPENFDGVCPQCREKGAPVEGQTVKANISISLREVNEHANYFFCRTESCPVVYFDDAEKQTFSVDQIRVPVYQKQPDNPDVMICYCFRHTVGDVIAASAHARHQIINDINAGIKAAQCACNLRNPSGSCCLGNIRSFIRSLE